MLFPVCVTCNKLFADIHFEFEDKRTKIENNTKLTDNEKAKNISELLDNLHITRYCCRQRVLTYTKKVDLLI